MTTEPVTRQALADATLAAVEDELRRRVQWHRSWYRTGLGRNWPDLRAENRYVLGVLFGIRRAARAAVPTGCYDTHVYGCPCRAGGDPLPAAWDARKAEYDRLQLADLADADSGYTPTTATLKSIGIDPEWSR